MIEVEVKIAIEAIEPFINRIEMLGATRLHPRSLEDNVLLDSEEGTLRASGAILRIRQYGGRGLLTFKKLAPGPVGYKIRSETETDIPEPEQCLAILESAGLRRVWRYMKYRTIYGIDDLKLMLDETPIGNFLELEGPPEKIDAFARRLGKSPADYISSSYRTLQEQWCKANALPVGDMLFESGHAT